MASRHSFDNEEPVARLKQIGLVDAALAVSMWVILAVVTGSSVRLSSVTVYLMLTGLALLFVANHTLTTRADTVE